MDTLTVSQFDRIAEAARRRVVLVEPLRSHGRLDALTRSPAHRR